MLTLGVIYYIIHYYTYTIILLLYYTYIISYTYIIYYLILYSSPLLFYSSSILPPISSSVYILYYILSSPFLPIPPLFILYSPPSLPLIYPLSIHSILVGTYIRLFMFHSISSKYLTPHKLSEGCLEWCSFICVVFGSGVVFVVFRAGVMV